MKRFLCGILSICLVLGLSGCTDNTFADVKLDQEETLDEVTFRVDSGWETESIDGGIRYYPFSNKEEGYIQFFSLSLDTEVDIGRVNNSDVGRILNQIVMEASNGSFKGDTEKLDASIQGFPSGFVVGKIIKNETDYGAYTRIIITAKNAYVFFFIQNKALSKSFNNVIDSIFSSVKIDKSASNVREPIGAYMPAYYEKYNSYSSDNKLGGSLIYSDGIVKEVIEEKDAFYFILEQDDGKSWLITAGIYPDFVPDGLESFKGKNVRVFFQYVSYSDKFKMPTGYLFTGGKLENLEDGSVYTPKATPDEDYCTWVDENGEEATYKDIADGKCTGKYVMISGLISFISKNGPSQEVSLNLYELADGEYNLYHINCALNQSIASELQDDEAVKMYGFVDYDNTFKVHSFKRIEPSFTMEDVNAARKREYKSYGYDSLARNPNLYTGEKVVFTGEVVQVVESGYGLTLRVNVTKTDYSYKDTIYVTGSSLGADRVLDGDIITIWGTFDGLKTYESVLGASITIPSIKAHIIEIK